MANELNAILLHNKRNGLPVALIVDGYTKENIIKAIRKYLPTIKKEHIVPLTANPDGCLIGFTETNSIVSHLFRNYESSFIHDGKAYPFTLQVEYITIQK